MTPMKDFNLFMSQLQETNQTLDFFCDFDKISLNVEDIKLSLCMLNSLIGASDMRRAVETIWKRDRAAFKVMDILIAVRSEGKKVVLDSQGQCVVLDSLFDSNARKNRSGHVMENMIAHVFDNQGIIYRQEVYSSEWPAISKVLGDDEKRFDFVIETEQKIFLIEVNFYSSGGSKLNEVARSYSDIAPKINSVSGFEFVWITDGIGWKSARNKLQEAYNIIPSIYNLTNMQDFINLIKA